MGRGRRTGPGGASEVRVGRIRAAALSAATDLVEDELAVGLETIHLGTIMLLGLCCRHLGPGDSARAYPSWEDWWEDEIVDDPAPGKIVKSTPLAMCNDPSPVPFALEAPGGVRIAPIHDEYVRLEGYRWASHWDRGCGSVFCIDSFGSRGEAVLVPEFCQIIQPDSKVYLEVEGKPSSASWLCPGLAELSAKANPRKLALPELIVAIKESPSITLVVPAGKVVFKDSPSSAEFARKAARRHPLYVNAVEMGARLLLSMVPPLKIETTTDSEILQKQLGAQIFPIAGHRARLCVRCRGGPPLDAARIAGSTLDDVCRYVGTAWVNTLAAAPSTWTRLNTLVERAIDLEVALGPAGQDGLPVDYVPGFGTFMPARQRLRSRDSMNSQDVPMCQVCKLHEVVGMEALRHGDCNEMPDIMVHICAECMAFVPGSASYRQKEALAQHTSRPVHAILGAADAGLDHILQKTEKPRYDDDEEQKASISYKVDLVPKDACVLAVGAMLSLRTPPGGWGDPAQQQEVLHKELQKVLKCPDEVVRILSIRPESDAPNLMVSFLLMHPAVFKAGRSEPQQSILELQNEDCTTPLTPLTLYLKLARILEGIGHISPRSPRKNMLVPSNMERVILPCSLFLLRSQPGRPPFNFGDDSSELVPAAMRQAAQTALVEHARSIAAVVDVQNHAADIVRHVSPDDKRHNVQETLDSALAAAVSGQDVAAKMTSIEGLQADKQQLIEGLQAEESPIHVQSLKSGEKAMHFDSLVEENSKATHVQDTAEQDGADACQSEAPLQEGIFSENVDGDSFLTSAEQNGTGLDAALAKDGYRAEEQSIVEEAEGTEGDASKVGPADAELVEATCGGELVHALEDPGSVMEGIEALGLEGGGQRKRSGNPTPASSSACIDSDSVTLHFQSFGSELAAPMSQQTHSRIDEDEAQKTTPVEQDSSISDSVGLLSEEPGYKAAHHVSSEELGAASAQPEEDSQEFQGTPSDNPVVNAILIFRPSPRQLALRVRELVAANGSEPEEKARNVDNLLTRWGQSSATGGVSLAALAAASRDPASLRGQSSLDVSIRDANHPVTHVLLNHVQYCDQTAKLLNERNPVTGHTPLYAAVLYPSSRHTPAVVRKLIERRANINLPGSSPHGRVVETSLMNCVRRAEMPVIECMLELRAEVNGISADGKTMLQVAVDRTDEEIMQTMLRAPGCLIDEVDSHGRTALITALRGGKYARPLVCQLLDAQADPARADTAGTLPIIFAASILRDPSTCKQLLACRADPDSADVSKDAHVIHLAARARNEHLLSALLGAGADPNVKELQGRTALHLALGLTLSLQILREILQARADPGAHTGATAGGETPLRLAVMAGTSPPTPAGKSPGLRRPGLAAEVDQGAPPDISISAMKEWDACEAVELLLEARADPNASNLAGCTALHAACTAGNLVIAQMLVASGADPTLTDKRRWAPIHFCASDGQDVVRWLLSLRVDAAARTFHGATPRLVLTTRSEDPEKVRLGQTALEGVSPRPSLRGTLLNAMSKTEGFKRHTPRGLQSMRRPRGVFGRSLVPSTASENETQQSFGTWTSGITQACTIPSDRPLVLPAIP